MQLTCDIIDRVEAEDGDLVGNGHWVAPESGVVGSCARTASVAAWRASSRTSARSAPDGFESGAAWLATGAATVPVLAVWALAGWSVAAVRGALMQRADRHDQEDAQTFLLRSSEAIGEGSGLGQVGALTVNCSIALITFENAATPGLSPGNIVGHPNRDSSYAEGALSQDATRDTERKFHHSRVSNFCLRSGGRDGRA
jgi:hypothetical protein